MKKQQTRLKTSGLSLNFPVGAPTSLPSIPVREQVPAEPVLSDYVKTSLVDPLRKLQSNTNDAVKALSSSSTSSNNPDSVKKSRKARKRAATEKNNFIPVPKGSAMFMFQGVEGKTRSTKVVVTSACRMKCHIVRVPGS